MLTKFVWSLLIKSLNMLIEGLLVVLCGAGVVGKCRKADNGEFVVCKGEWDGVARENVKSISVYRWNRDCRFPSVDSIKIWGNSVSCDFAVTHCSFKSKVTVNGEKCKALTPTKPSTTSSTTSTTMNPFPWPGPIHVEEGEVNTTTTITTSSGSASSISTTSSSTTTSRRFQIASTTSMTTGAWAVIISVALSVGGGVCVVLIRVRWRRRQRQNQERRDVGRVETVGAGGMVVVSEEAVPLSPRRRQRRLSSKSMESIELFAVDKMD